MRTYLMLAAFAAACGSDKANDVTPDAAPPACDPTTQACVYAKDVSTMTVPAGHEDEDTCQSWTLNNPTELWVHEIAQTNGGAYHHANWFFVPDDEFQLPDSYWSCGANHFDELVAALDGGYLFALSTQSAAEQQVLPDGAAIRIPPYSRIIGASHLLNATDNDITTTMHLAISTIPPAAVTAKLAPARIQYQDLHIDPNAKSTFTTECDFATTYQHVRGGPLQYRLYYTLSHYHVLGTFQQLEVMGGPNDGQVIMRHDGFGNNAGTAIEPFVDLGALGATGLRLTCGYDNPRDAEVGWGIGDQEMCVIALQAVTDVGFEADVTAGTQGDEIVSTAADGTIQHQGGCQVLGFAWDFSKPGGQGH
ncbi:MAG TPA: hypothetical protein VGM88_33645 [Kofleriaceae bacterium]|jgi:hypothetical protein